MPGFLGYRSPLSSVPFFPDGLCLCLVSYQGHWSVVSMEGYLTCGGLLYTLPYEAGECHRVRVLAANTHLIKHRPAGPWLL